MREQGRDATAANRGHGLSAAYPTNGLAGNRAVWVHQTTDLPPHKAGSEKHLTGLVS